MTEISIAALLKSFGRPLALRLLAGEAGLERCINNSDTHRPALALTGFVEVISFDMVQILGNHELEYLRSLPRERRRQALEIIYQFEMPCVVITGRGQLLNDIKELADKHGVPLLHTRFNTTRFIHLFHLYLDDVFSPYVMVHATLVDVNGIGLLFTGRSAIGKSEVGLDLVARGHRLVADDTVLITRRAQGILMGQSPQTLQDYMEIRGIGLIDVKRLFGVKGIRRQKRVEVVAKLVDWNENMDYERTGLEDHKRAILGVEVPEVTVPLFPGKNITVIAETIALNHLLRLEGYHPAREFNRRLLKKMRKAPGRRRPGAVPGE